MKWTNDDTLIVLCSFTVFFAIMFVFMVYFPTKDAQALTVVTGLFTGFAAALTLHLKSEKSDAKAAVDAAAAAARAAVEMAAQEARMAVKQAAMDAKFEKDK